MVLGKTTIQQWNNLAIGFIGLDKPNFVCYNIATHLKSRNSGKTSLVASVPGCPWAQAQKAHRVGSPTRSGIGKKAHVEKKQPAHAGARAVNQAGSELRDNQPRTQAKRVVLGLSSK